MRSFSWRELQLDCAGTVLTGIIPARPRLNNTPLEYWTGYREKYRDGPEPAGSLALKFDPHVIRSQMILPVSMVSMTSPFSLVPCLG